MDLFATVASGVFFDNATPAFSNSGLCGGGDGSYGYTQTTDYVYTPSTMYATMDGATSWTIEGYVYITGYGANQAIFGGIAGAAGHPSLYHDSTGSFAWNDGATDTYVFVGGAVLNTCINWAVSADGANVRIYFDNVLKATKAQKNYPTGGISLGVRGTPAQYPSAASYIDNVRISNITRSSFPTVDS
jgi:hypothetical protein